LILAAAIAASRFHPAAAAPGPVAAPVPSDQPVASAAQLPPGDAAATPPAQLPDGEPAPAAPPATSTSPPVAAVSSGWETLPIWGADVRSMAVAPDDPDLVLAGTTTGQLYISRNGGASWADAGAPLPFAGWVVSALRWDPNHAGRLWVALWGVWGGGQVAVSDNLGKSWAARSKGLPEEPVYSLALAPGRDGHLFAGTLSGVYGSDDGGGSWRQLTGAEADIQKVTSLVVDPTRPDTVIAGTWRRAYRSDDAGHTWTGIFEGMVLDTEIFSFTPVPEHPGEIWASSCGWVYQTVDHGDHWVRFKDFDERRTLSFAVTPDGRLLAGTVAGVYTSADRGKSWRRLSDPALSVSAIAYHPARPNRILIGTEGSGIWISTNGGVDFFRSSRGMAATRVGALALAGDDLLAAVNHAGPLSGIYVSHDRGKSFDGDFKPLPTVLDLALYGGRAYAATTGGLFERRGADWHRLPELGTQRVEQLLVEEGAPPPPRAPAAGTPPRAPAGARLVARTWQGIFELEKGVFVRRAWKHGAPRSTAFYDGALWVSDADGVYQLTRDANHTVAAPFAGGHLHRLGEQLLLSGSGGAWTRMAPSNAGEAGAPGGARDAGGAGGAGEEWVQLTAEPTRIVPTGDSRFAAVMLSGDVMRLYDRERRKFRVMPVPVPARDVVAALVMDGKLLLATSGYGVVVHDLD